MKKKILKKKPPDIETEFVIDSGEETNTINLPARNEIHNLHPKFFASKTSYKLATAQGTNLTKYGKNFQSLIPTRKMEQNKLLLKPFKKILRKTDIKHKISGVPFITKNIPTTNILNSKLQTKEKYLQNLIIHLYYFFKEKINNPIFSKFYTMYNQQKKTFKTTNRAFV